MPKVTLPDLIARRVGPSIPRESRLTYEEISERSGGLISATHINDLKTGRRDPRKLTVEKICALAKGLKESPVIVFEACAGDLYPGLKDHALAQLLSDFAELRTKSKPNTDLDFAFRLLKEKIEQAKSDRDT